MTSICLFNKSIFQFFNELDSNYKINSFFYYKYITQFFDDYIQFSNIKFINLNIF